jgi:hypothetical protein
MKFLSENERMQHPQARLIPLNVWKTFYSDELSDFQLALMQTASSDYSNYLAGLDNGALQDLTTIKKISADWLAMAYGHPDAKDYLLMNFARRLNIPTEEVFKLAAIIGKMSMMEHLMKLAPDKVQDMIAADRYSTSYEAFRVAAINGHTPVVNRLLLFFSVFAYAESHNQEYGAHYIYPLVRAKLSTLQEGRASLERDNPQAVFDINNPEEAKLCFYKKEQIYFQIPKYQAGAELLLTVPAVHALAQQNDFYQREALGVLDFTALARDRESSMTALTSGEQKRLEAAIKTYKPVVNGRGIDSLMTELRSVLMARYQANPAKVNTGDGRVIDLPASWDEWRRLREQFSPDTQELALKAYAQHKDHTAWRYLEKPNLWMAADAPYVNRNDAGGWSTFEDYQPLIALFYLGASDGNAVPCDGHTFDTRLEHFIDELAHIGRAHNWDRTRISGQGTEEYDDLEGDKPSCYSGVKRRLFQSVLGHPLFKLLTLDDVKQELREFVREHFQQCIQTNPGEAIEWKKTWGRVCEADGDPEVDGALSALNIPESKQAAFIKRLGDKYPAQFNEDLSFKTYIQDRFKLTEHISTHAAGFGGEADLMGLLETNASKIQEEPDNDEPMPPAAIQPPDVAAKPHIQSFLDDAFKAMDALEEYSAGASVREIINQLRESITQINTIYSRESSFTPEQQNQLKAHLAALKEGLGALRPNHFEGKPKNDFTSIIRSMLNGVTLLFSWLGAPKDRNLLAEITGRPFFFQRSRTQEETQTIT